MNEEKMPAFDRLGAIKNACQTARRFNAALRTLDDHGLLPQTKDADGKWIDLKPLEFRLMTDVTDGEYFV